MLRNKIIKTMFISKLVIKKIFSKKINLFFPVYYPKPCHDYPKHFEASTIYFIDTYIYLLYLKPLLFNKLEANSIYLTPKIYESLY